MVPLVSAAHPPWLKGGKGRAGAGIQPCRGAGFNAGCSELLTEVASCAVARRLLPEQDRVSGVALTKTRYILHKMKPATGHYLILGCFCLAFYSGCTSYKFLESEHHPHTWKKLFLVHHWPVTVCKMSENDCKDPPQYWTIHGLWKHEWEKHGTCAATVEPLNSQKKYFGRTLDLYQKLDLNSCLLKVGIKPSSTYYQMTAIKEALTSVYGVTPKVQCLPPEEGEEVQTIGQIEFCFTKELELRNCTNSEADSYVMPNNWHFGPEELSVCNDTLTYYPAQVKFYN
ncbi:ribonuclease T2 isoform X2 [Chrysemys picta bellii]|uniref:ribonuclease T2 isoform X2 n=1 Tax=Chrysemys picta bellii TaxID=8478 RepID=UPI001C6647B2|nr:ribonuclease T2 isoform X3 [Chrysemys picta bellii]